MTGLSNAPLSITLDGQKLEPAAARAMADVIVRQVLDAPAVAELAFAEPPAQLLNDARIGAAIEVQTPKTTLFKGEITGVSHERRGGRDHVFRIRGYDRLHRLRKRQSMRALNDITLDALVSRVAADLQVTCEAPKGLPARALVLQYDQSDFELLRGIASDLGVYLQLDGDVVRILSLAGSGDPIELNYGETLFEAKVELGGERLRRTSRVQALDPARLSSFEGEASSPRGSQARDFPAFSDLGCRTRSNMFAADTAEAEAIAQADLDHGAACAAVIEAMAEGDAALRPGAVVEVAGLGEQVDGRFVIARALHRFDEVRGYLTEFSSEPPSRRGRSSMPVFAIGRVSNIDDPDKLFRVKATLPACGGLETGWMQVMAPGAGAEKGIIAPPDVGDDVLIVCPDANLARGIVLGGLFGTRIAPDGGAEQSGDGRPFLVSPADGQLLVIEAARAFAALGTSAGDRLEMGPDGSCFHATRDLVIEAPGRTLTFRARAVAFEQG